MWFLVNPTDQFTSDIDAPVSHIHVLHHHNVHQENHEEHGTARPSAFNDPKR